MKRLLSMFLIVIIMAAAIGCAVKSKEETSIYSLIEEYGNFSDGGIVDADIRTIKSLDEKMQDVQYRVLGILSDVDLDHNEFFDIADLSNGEFTIRAYFEKDSKIIEGEYVEVVGHFQSGYLGDGHLYNCVVVERGASVRE